MSLLKSVELAMERDHYKEQAERMAESNKNLEARNANQVNIIMGLQKRLDFASKRHNVSNDILDEKQRIIEKQAQRILALDWAVENFASKASPHPSLRNENYLDLAREVIAEYPMYRTYAQPFKESLRIMLNKFVIERVKCEP